MKRIYVTIAVVILATTLAACAAASSSSELEEAPALRSPSEADSVAFDRQPGQQHPNPPGTMIFEDYGVSPFFDATTDNLSTFAIDVDSGSYTITRSYLGDSFLPPPEAIRTEEFINFFEQNYPQPQEGSFYIDMEAAPTPFSAPTRYVMRVGIQGYEVAPEERTDASLIFVIDVSGSMAGEDRLEAVKDALYTLVEQLRPSDTVGIVIYGSRGTGRARADPGQPITYHSARHRQLATRRLDQCRRRLATGLRLSVAKLRLGAD